MKKINLTEKEADIVWEALAYFQDDATHYNEDDKYYDGCCGLSKQDKRYKHVDSVLMKLKKGDLK